MKTLFTFLVFIFFFTTAQAQDIDATLGGNTSNEEFSVKDNGGTILFRVGGDGNVGIGTSTPGINFNTRFDVVGSTVFRTNPSATNQGLVIDYIGTSQRIYSGVSPSGTAYDLILGTYPNGHLNQLFLQQSTGNVGIGTASPMALLHVNGSAGNNTGVWSNLSDQRLKKDIVLIQNALKTVKQLKGVTFRWKDPEKDEEYGRVRGLIAQDVERVLAEWVKTDPDGYKRLEPIGIHALLIEAIKEQQKQIEALEERINSIALKELNKESYGYIKTNINK